MNRLGQIAVVGELDEFAGEDWPIAADTAGKVERWRPGFAATAVLSLDQRSPVIGIGINPDHREDSVLVCRLGASGGHVSTGPTLSKRGHRRRWMDALAALPLTGLDRSRDRLDQVSRQAPSPLAVGCRRTSHALATVAGAIEHLPPLRSGDDPSTRA